ncbi:hypothetical protein [Peribacillus frigoritolerans]|uniref:hypothetical protein n=1 Tax=Peribacillus frigoritolerans TaxID=450367 RepID=UPI0033057E5B
MPHECVSIKDLQNLAESADETELSDLSGIVSGLKAKVEQGNRSYFSILLQLKRCKQTRDKIRP